MFSFFKKKNEKKYMWSCDSCSTPIAVGDDRYHCLDCANYDLCPKCHKKGVHNSHELVFEKEQVTMLRELVVLFLFIYINTFRKATGQTKQLEICSLRIQTENVSRHTKMELMFTLPSNKYTIGYSILQQA